MPNLNKKGQSIIEWSGLFFKLETLPLAQIKGSNFLIKSDSKQRPKMFVNVGDFSSKYTYYN